MDHLGGIEGPKSRPRFFENNIRYEGTTGRRDLGCFAARIAKIGNFPQRLPSASVRGSARGRSSRRREDTARIRASRSPFTPRFSAESRRDDLHVRSRPNENVTNRVRCVPAPGDTDVVIESATLRRSRGVRGDSGRGRTFSCNEDRYETRDAESRWRRQWRRRWRRDSAVDAAGVHLGFATHR